MSSGLAASAFIYFHFNPLATYITGTQKAGKRVILLRANVTTRLTVEKVS